MTNIVSLFLLSCFEDCWQSRADCAMQQSAVGPLSALGVSFHHLAEVEGGLGGGWVDFREGSGDSAGMEKKIS